MTTSAAASTRSRVRCGSARGTFGRLITALAVVIINGACLVVIKASGAATPPLRYAALRALLAGFPLLLLGVGTRRLLPPRREWGWIALLGVTSTGLGFAGMFLTVRAAGATIPAVVANSQALLTAPFAALLFREPLGRGRILGLLLGVAGVGLTVSGNQGRLGEIVGISLALMAAGGVAGGNLVTKVLGPRVDALTATGWQYLVGGSLLLIVSVPFEAGEPFAWSPAFLAGLLFLALVGSAGASWAWFRLIATGELVPLAGLTLLTPGVALLLAFVAYREPVTPLGLIGLLVTVLGLTWVGWPAKPAPGATGDSARS